MPSIKDLGGGKNRVFICNGFKADGKVNRTSKVITAKSLRDAEKQANALEVDFKRGQQVQFTHAPTFCDLVNTWRELQKVKLEDKTKERMENFLKMMIPYFGNMKVRDIKALNIEAYLNTLKKDGVRLDGKSGGYSEKYNGPQKSDQWVKKDREHGKIKESKKRRKKPWDEHSTVRSSRRNWC